METTISPTIQTDITKFLAMLAGKNRSSATIGAYKTDLSQFFTYTIENDMTVTTTANITRTHVSDFLAYLAQERGLSGVSRARKLAAIREFFRFLVAHDLMTSSPVEKVETPKQEKKTRNRLRQDEYTQLLSLAGSNPRDYAILMVLLQCGLRVTELCNLSDSDIDLTANILTVRDGKGMVAREIVLEKKVIKALKSYLAVRGSSLSPALFLTRYGEPMSRFAIRKLIIKLCREAGMDKKISPHIFRHTFASVKAEKGVSPYQLQAWLGHKDIKTTQIYVHMSKEYAKKAMEATSL